MFWVGEAEAAVVAVEKLTLAAAFLQAQLWPPTAAMLAGAFVAFLVSALQEAYLNVQQLGGAVAAPTTKSSLLAAAELAEVLVSKGRVGSGPLTLAAIRE
jgi:hypothetical protein